MIRVGTLHLIEHNSGRQCCAVILRFEPNPLLHEHFLPQQREKNRVGIYAHQIEIIAFNR